MDISMNNNDDSKDDYEYDYDDLVVKKGTVRYKFVIVLFILAYFVILYLHKTKGFQDILLVFLNATQIEQVKKTNKGWYADKC